FTDIDFVTSAGLRAVLLLMRKAKASGGAFALSGVNVQVREILDVSGLAEMFSIHSGRAEGIASLQRDGCGSRPRTSRNDPRQDGAPRALPRPPRPACSHT